MEYSVYKLGRICLRPGMRIIDTIGKFATKFHGQDKHESRIPFIGPPWLNQAEIRQMFIRTSRVAMGNNTMPTNG